MFEQAWKNNMNPAPSTHIPSEISGRWTPPPLGWVKMNLDITSKGNPGKAGYGGVIRDAEGQWCSGFMQFVGDCNALTSEACTMAWH